eukprot:TRINITY_DN1810_c0_g1_i1.p1 TRINITY_DN1810_c0_g1~~TRINITY_DN1810_c0_g1_i1.p1  ORF type:complete len:469 (-),score=147.55 TRINITY_DN1810_c0_g1_i1:1395-2633(-)
MPPQDATRVLPDWSGAAQIVFYDLETTIPSGLFKEYDIIEFAAVVLDKTSFEELECYSTLIYSDKVTPRSVEANHITQEMLVGLPRFEEVADRIHQIMHGKLWAGHNIDKFDNVRIRESFARINRPAPECCGSIDTLPLLAKLVQNRAGNLKLATLGRFFKLGEEQHRSESDIRMNIAVLKNCALTHVLEVNYGETQTVGITTSTTAPPSPAHMPHRFHARHVSSDAIAEDSVALERARTLVDSAITEGRCVNVQYAGGRTPGGWRTLRPTAWKGSLLFSGVDMQEYTYRLDRVVAAEPGARPFGGISAGLEEDHEVAALAAAARARRHATTPPALLQRPMSTPLVVRPVPLPAVPAAPAPAPVAVAPAPAPVAVAPKRPIPLTAQAAIIAFVAVFVALLAVTLRLVVKTLH